MKYNRIVLEDLKMENRHEKSQKEVATVLNINSAQ